MTPVILAMFDLILFDFLSDQWWVCDCRDFVLGSAVEDMQVGCLWQGDFLLSVSLSGFINYLDKSSGRLSRIVKVW